MSRSLRDQMVQECLYDEDCDELNFCHETTRICTEIGLYDPCRIPGNRPDIAHFWNDTGIGESWLDGLYNFTAEIPGQARIYLPPLCPPELACSMSLKRCIKPLTGQRLVSLFDLTWAQPSTYYSRMGYGQFPLDTCYHFVDDRNTSIGKTCRRDVHCAVGYECFRGRCQLLPGLHAYCSPSSRQCRKPFICSERGICSLPCLDDLDCSALNENKAFILQKYGLGMGTMEAMFVCKPGNYCSVEENHFNALVYVTIVIPIVLLALVIVILIVKNRRHGKTLRPEL